MRVLQVTIFPIKNPRHGGQIRVSQIKKKLESLGCDVRCISVSRTAPIDHDPINDFFISPFAIWGGKNDVPFCDDYLISKRCQSDGAILNFITKHVKNFKPEIIIFEHPWLWPAIKSLLQLKILDREKMCLIYSSQNIESEIKKIILEKEGVSKSIIKEIQDGIFALEKEVTSAVDFNLCVSEEDGGFLGKFSKFSPWVLPNGVSRRVIFEENVDSEMLSLLKNTNYLLLIASAHPPNIVGFWEMLGPSLARFSLESKIFIVGSAGWHILRYSSANFRMFSEVNKIVMKDLGVVSEEVLAVILHYSSGILLPITYGGGSNLKTAEALVAYKPVISTTVACRGYERLMGKISNFYICDDAKKFSQTANDVVSKKIKWVDISDEEKEARATVYWDNTLAPLGKLLNEIKKR